MSSGPRVERPDGKRATVFAAVHAAEIEVFVFLKIVIRLFDFLKFRYTEIIKQDAGSSHQNIEEKRKSERASVEGNSLPIATLPARV